MPRRASISRLALFAILSLAPALGCSSSRGGPVSDTEPVPQPSAQQQLARMQALLREAMRTVAPDAVPRAEESPVRFDCDGPKQGQSYYTWNLSFDLPEGRNGDAVVPSAVAFFAARGFTTQTDPDAEGAQIVRGGDGTMGFALSGAHKNAKVSIEGSSGCGV